MAAAYTLARWQVKDGNEAEFLRTWREDLAELFIRLNPGATGTLVRSVDDPLLFYSFGPWNDLQDILNMRAMPEAQTVFEKLIGLCDEATPGAFLVEMKVP